MIETGLTALFVSIYRLLWQSSNLSAPHRGSRLGARVTLILVPISAISPDYSRSSSRGVVSRGECEEKDDMAAQHIGEYVSKDMAFFDEAGARLTTPQ